MQDGIHAEDQRDRTQAGRCCLTHDDVRCLCGDLTDENATAILAAGGRLEDLETAVAWAAGESDVMGEARRLLASASGRIYEILTRDEALWDERDRTAG